MGTWRSDRGGNVFTSTQILPNTRAQNVNKHAHFLYSDSTVNEESRDSVSSGSSSHEVIHVHENSPAHGPAARPKTLQKKTGPSDNSKTVSKTVSKQNKAPPITVRQTNSVPPQNTTQGETGSGGINRSDPSESLEHTINTDQADNRTVASDMEQSENESIHL